MDETIAKFYRYRLCSDVQSNAMMVEGIEVKKEWLVRKEEIVKFNNWLRTPSNPKGMIEKDVFNANDEKSILVERKVYTADELLAMKRPDITPVADSWEVKHVGVKKDKLIELLCERFALESSVVKEEVVEDTQDADDIAVDTTEQIIEEVTDEIVS